MDPLGEHDPKQVGPYRLLGRLGAGGMGQVFLGTNDRAGRGELVAIKVVHPGLAHDDKFRSRFRREVEISRRVTGPWVAAVVDADPDAPTPWLATQYVQGPSLDTAVETHGPLAADKVHALAHGLALALTAVHEAGLVHRDLKPSNVLLGSDHPRLIDFGISRAIDGTRMTSTGVVIGTPAFMSPEQIAGEDVGPASDVFSLGSVLAYAATGRSPFGDHPPVVLMMRISGHDPDLDGVPDVLHETIAACLAKRPEDRPTAADLGGMLGTVAADQPGWLPADVAALGADADGPTVPHPRTRVVTELRPPAKAALLSRRAWLTTLGIVGLTAAGGLGLAAYSRPQPNWTATVPWQGDVAGAAADDRSLYLYSHDGDGAVLALDSATGAERWSVPGWARPAAHTSDVVAVVPVGEAILIGTATVLAALDAATGRRRWEVPRSTSRPGMAVADGIVMATTLDGLVALDAGTGSRIWKADLDTSPDAAEVAAQNGVCFLGNGDIVDALELRTGRQLWSYPSSSYYSSTSVLDLVAAGDVVFAEYSDAMVGLYSATGQKRWENSWALSSLPIKYLGIAGTVVVAYGDNEAGEGRVQVLSPTSGSALWSQSDPEWDASVRIIGADGIVYVSPLGQTLSGYDAATGVKRWSYEQGFFDTQTVIAARGRDVYLHGSRGEVQALTIV